MKNSLTIKIFNFRCYKEQIFNFKRGITLIHGSSGAGKSTIFQALLWCLYGSLKNIKPKDTKRCSTTIIIEVDDFIIARQSTPKEIIFRKVEYIDEVNYQCIYEYTGDEAQSFINMLYGPELYFITGSYIEQGERCPLLNGKNQEKIELLNSIVYGSSTGTQSEFYQIEIKSKIQYYEISLSQFNGIYSNLFREINNIVSLNSLTHEDKIEKNKLNELIDKKSELENKCIDLKSKKIAQEKTMKYIDQIKQNLNTYMKELNSYSKEDVSDSNQDKLKEFEIKLSNLYLEIKKIEDNMKLKINIEIKQEELNKLKKNFDGNIIKYSREQISKRYNDEIQERDIKNKYIGKEGSEYSLENIMNRIKYYKLLIKYYDMIPLYTQYVKFEKNPPDEIIKEDLDKEEEKYSSMITGIRIQNCPYCDNKLMINGKDIVKCGIEHVYTINEKDEQKRKLNQVSQKYKNFEQYKELKILITEEVKESMIELLKHGSSNFLGGKQEIAQRYIFVSNIVYRELDSIDHDTMIYSNKIIEKEEELKHLKSGYKSNLDINIESMYIETKKLHDKINNIKAILRIKNNIYETNEELKNISCDFDSNISSKITDIIEEIKQLSIKIERGKIFDIYENKQIEFNQIKTSIETYNKYIMFLRELLGIISLAEKMIYEDALVTINNLFNDILKEIFEEPINIEIEFLKKEKFSIKITLKGYEYEKVNFLSGGEADRISFALAIVMNMIHCNTPFLFIDESISSLDINGKEKCIKTLRDNINGYVLVVNHDAVEGSYDDVVYLND